MVTHVGMPGNALARRSRHEVQKDSMAATARDHSDTVYSFTTEELSNYLADQGQHQDVLTAVVY